MSFIDDLNWRYATKQFNPEKRVSEKDLTTLKEAVRLSASSFGLQLYSVLVIEDKSVREQLVEHSWGQKQVVDASHLFVFCNDAEFTTEKVDTYLELIADTRGVTTDSLADYGGAMKNFASNMPAEAKTAWMQRQAYIAMTNLLSAAATLKIDTCPMEGFIPEKYNEILGLTEKGLNACVVVPVGYRSDEDKYQHLAKVRKSTDKLFIHI